MAINKRLEKRFLREIKKYGNVEPAKKDGKHHYFSVFKHPIISICAGGEFKHQIYRTILNEIKLYNIKKKEE